MGQIAAEVRGSPARAQGQGHSLLDETVVIKETKKKRASSDMLTKNRTERLRRARQTAPASPVQRAVRLTVLRINLHHIYAPDHFPRNYWWQGAGQRLDRREGSSRAAGQMVVTSPPATLVGKRIAEGEDCFGIGGFRPCRFLPITAV